MERPFIPYGRQSIDDSDIEVVTRALRGDWLTTGPTVAAFEQAFADAVGATHAIACSSGTAALHLGALALQLGPGKTVITTPNSFVATANAADYVGAELLFADIDPLTGNMTPETLREALSLASERGLDVGLVVPVHFGGQPVEISELSILAHQAGALVMEDACHALGATYADGDRSVSVGACAHGDLAVFSLHPVKHITAGEGGMLTTNDDVVAQRLRQLRTLGIERRPDHFLNDDLAVAADGEPNPWYYEQQALGFNYRLTDFQSALGLNQLGRLEQFVSRRREIAALYDEAFCSDGDGPVQSLSTIPGVGHAYHLYVLRIAFDQLGVDRALVMKQLRARGIGTQVHYIPIHLQPYYAERHRQDADRLTGVADYYRQCLSIPMFPGMQEAEVQRVIAALHDCTGGPA